MEKELDKDAERRKVLSQIYDSVLDMFEFQNRDLKIKEEFQENVETLKSNWERLQKKHCPIIVAGETSAGKSSLVNLIIREHLLPEQVLCSSSTVCQIFNDKQKKAVVIDEEENEIDIVDVTEETLSKYVCAEFSEQNMRRYKRVDIYWPVDILKENASIVDTPGIGESMEMTAKLLDYLSEAVAFIYVINTTNGGGVQNKKLVSIFEELRQMEENGNLHQFDPKCTIFVCNKWDQVPSKEDTKVWKKIAEKLQSVLPTMSKEEITKQMFRLSVKEEIENRNKELKSTDMYTSLSCGINRLVSVCSERRSRNHVNWLQTFLDRALKKAVEKINNSKTEVEMNGLKKAEVEKRLKILENETQNIQSNMKTLAEKKCKDIAEKLTKYLNDEKTLEKMLHWRDGDLPDYKKFDNLKEGATKLIVDRITNQIRQWSREHSIKDIPASLFDCFIDELKLMKGDVREIDQIIQEIRPPINHENLQNLGSNTRSQPLTVIDTIIIVLSAPLWIPITVAASPFIFIGSAISEKIDLSQYKKNKVAFMGKFAKEVLGNYNKDMIYNGLSVKFVQDFMSNINYVCESIIPKQIIADRKLIEKMTKQGNNSQTLQKEYFEIKSDFQKMIGELLYAKIKHFSDDLPSICKEGPILGKGSFSVVHLCDVDFHRSMGIEQCAVKRPRLPIQMDQYLQLSEAENIMNFQNPNIVICHGIFIKEIDSLDIFMEVCNCSLADVFLCDEHRTNECQCNPHRRKACHLFAENDRNGPEYTESFQFVIKILKDILNGLAFLHDQDFVHKDLKLSNILMKDGTAKIGGLGVSKSRNLSSSIITRTPLNIAPEVLQDRKYSPSSDIFSLAIITWEMWYGRRAFIEDEFDGAMFYFFLKMDILNGTRPKFDKKWPPPELIQEMMRNGWEKDADKRPTANELITMLQEISGV